MSIATRLPVGKITYREKRRLVKAIALAVEVAYRRHDIPLARRADAEIRRLAGWPGDLCYPSRGESWRSIDSAHSCCA